MSLASLGEEVLPFLSPDCSLPRTRKGRIRAVGVQWSQRTLWNLPVARTAHASTRPADGGRVVQVDPCNDRSIDNFQRMEVTSMPSISLQGEVTKRTPRTPKLEELPICAPSLIQKKRNYYEEEEEEQFEDAADDAGAASSSPGAPKHFLQSAMPVSSGLRNSQWPMPLRRGTVYPHAVAVGNSTSSAYMRRDSRAFCFRVGSRWLARSPYHCPRLPRRYHAPPRARAPNNRAGRHRKAPLA